MYSVILVEDEILVRIGLKSSINWAKFDMKVVSEFSNGKTALDYFVKYKPDIVITDLKMREMDGLTLISRIRETNKDTRIIILSCLEEFDLVRKAMSLGVSDYVPKLTMTTENIDMVLTKVLDEIKNIRGQQAAALPANRYTDLDKEMYFKEFLLYGLHTPQEFRTFAAQSGLHASPEKLVFCLLEVEGYEQIKQKYEDEDGHLVRIAILNVLTEVLAGYKRVDAFNVNGPFYALLIGTRDILGDQAAYNEINAIVAAVRGAVKMCFNMVLSVGVSSTGAGYASIKRLFHEARKALDNRFYVGNNSIFFHGQGIDSGIVAKKLRSLCSFPELELVLGHNNAKEFSNKIESVIHAFPVSPQNIKSFFLQLVQWISHVACPGSDEFIAAVISASNSIISSETLDEMTGILTRYLSEIQKKSMEKRRLSKEITDTIHYLRLNFDTNINLQQVADHVKLSPNYLSNLFKKEIQINFTDYLTQLRIEKAKELLLRTNMKSYEISEITGFSDNAYFSKVFKKLIGISPNEFRKEWPKGQDQQCQHHTAISAENESAVV